MIRLPGLFWLIVVAVAGFAMFAVKYQVQAVADQLSRTTKQADEVQRSNRVLDAEWAYLNRPDALAQMNQRFLGLVPLATKQLRSRVEDLPLRPVPPPPPPSASAPAVAAVATAAAPGSQSAVVAAATPASSIDGSGAAAPPATVASAAAPVSGGSSGGEVALDRPALPRPLKLAAVSKPVRLLPARRAASLNELIAQIAESR
jgi:hypothetical protein